MKIRSFVVAGLLSVGIYAGVQDCKTDIRLAEDSMLRAQRFLYKIGDKAKATSEAQDAIYWATEALVDCTHAQGHARAVMRKAQRIADKINNYETEDEKMDRIMRERGLR